MPLRGCTGWTAKGCFRCVTAAWLAAWPCCPFSSFKKRKQCKQGTAPCDNKAQLRGSLTERVHRDCVPHMKQQATRHASWSDNQTTVSSKARKVAPRQGKARQVQGTPRMCLAAVTNSERPARKRLLAAASASTQPGIHMQITQEACWRLYQRAPSQVYTCRSVRKAAGGCISERPARKLPAGGCISERPVRYTYTCRWITPEQD
jgi:hypothetical protein